MDVKINRLDPNVPDPIESRRRAAGRLVRFFYATIVFGVLGFFIVYFGSPLVYLSGPGTVTSPRHVVSLPFTVQVNQMKLVPGATVKAGEEIAEVISPEQDSIVSRFKCTTSACSAASPTGSSISRVLSEHDAADVARSATRCRLKRINRCARLAAPKGWRFFRCFIT
jgi:hypothetical protein